MILLIDNFDSFTYNLCQMVGEITPDIRVVRNNAITVDEVREMDPDAIILSPGPGRPENSGVCPEVIAGLRGVIPMLGVCLGEQAIVTVYGGAVTYAKHLMHGKQSMVTLETGSELFRGLPVRIEAARYHSLAADAGSLAGTDLTVTAVADDGEVMAVEDAGRKVYGVQFHPESVMTPEGNVILRNFVRLSREK